MTERLSEAICKLHDIMAILRSPGGCPWDAEQTPESLKRYLIEETCEVLDALDNGHPPAIREELGDLLLQIVFHARIFEERQEFDLADVAASIAEKLVRRHPHVFAGEEVGSVEELARQWRHIKEKEKSAAAELGHPSNDAPPRTLPALLRARKVVEKQVAQHVSLAASLGAAEHALAHLRKVVNLDEPDGAESAFGELLFALVQLGHHLQIDCEDALRQEINRRTGG